MSISLNQISLRAKVILLVLMCCFILGAPTGFIALREIVHSHSRFDNAYRTSLFADFDAQAKSNVELAISSLQRVYDRSQKGDISLQEAKTIGADIIRNMHFGKDGYIWIDTLEGVNVAMLGRESVEGKNRINAQDATGKYFFREIIRVAQQPGGGFTDYKFPKPSGGEPLSKRSYSLCFQPFGWVLGTGNYLDDIEGLVTKASEENHRSLVNGIYVIVGVTILVVIVICLLVLVLTQLLIRQMGAEPVELARIAERVAEGDLTVRLVTGKTGVYEAMRRMVDNLQEVMHKVNQSSGELKSAAASLNANTIIMAQDSKKVVDQAQTVSTAGEEMASTSADIANNCHQAAGSSEHASHAAVQGAGIVRETVDGMGRIAEKVRNSARVVGQLGSRSEQIGEIIGTIEDIADQTNLLALNAAIEAARAGDQGRGFAVVADEVRALAERTTKATHEIGSMIKNIQVETRQAVVAMEEGVAEVERGMAGASQSGRSLETILKEVDEVTTQINQIATAAEEQTATTREIANNIHIISGTVQEGDRVTQEVSVASSRLSELSVELQDLVYRFKLYRD